MLAFKAVLSCLRMITIMLLISERAFTHQKTQKSSLFFFFSHHTLCYRGLNMKFSVRSLSIWESATGGILSAFLLLKFYKQALTEAGYMFQLCSYLFGKTSAIRYSFFVFFFSFLILAIGEKAWRQKISGFLYYCFAVGKRLVYTLAIKLLPNYSQSLALRNAQQNESWNSPTRSKGQCQIITIQDVNKPQTKNIVLPYWMLW